MTVASQPYRLVAERILVWWRSITLGIKIMLRVSQEPQVRPTRLLTRKDLSERLQISPRTLSRMVSDQRLPRPILIGRSVRWPEEVIETWIARQSGGSE